MHLRDTQGDVLVVAQLAGVTGAKLTSQLIPLCHSLNLRRAHRSIRSACVRSACLRLTR
jgi:cyclic pyranopterin phosphate synthase